MSAICKPVRRLIKIRVKELMKKYPNEDKKLLKKDEKESHRNLSNGSKEHKDIFGEYFSVTNNGRTHYR